MDLFSALLLTVNETLTAGNAIIAVSLLLFNLTRNLNNRVAKSSAIVLACVTAAYISDAFIALEPNIAEHEIASRLQWLGIAFIPAAIYHLSDALLATTGLPSRGRRRRVVRLLYLVGAAFLLAAAFTDSLVQFVTTPSSLSIQAGSAFAIYLLYFALANGFALYNVQRARKRCRTRATARRMGYLQIAFLTPSLGIFPYSVLLNPGDELSIFGLLVINIANVIIILMLFFLSYPLYFFGSDIPDRLVKRQLLDFLLRGPATGLIALAVINFTAQATSILGLASDAFTPPAVVATVLLWQWFVSLALPYFEKLFIYRDEDDAQITTLQTLSDRVLTHNDLTQLMLATTESICDHLRIDRAFVIGFEQTKAEFICKVGSISIADEELSRSAARLKQPADNQNGGPTSPTIPWLGYELFPLLSHRVRASDSAALKIGVLGLPSQDNTIVEQVHDPDGHVSGLGQPS